MTNVNGVNYVKSWNDKSTNLAHAVQATSGKQPVYVTNATFFGRPVVKFDGVNDVLVSSLAQIPGNKSIFIVHKRINILSQSSTELSSTSSTSAGFFLGNNVGTETQGRIGIAHDIQLYGSANDYILKASIRNGNSSTLYVNEFSTTSVVADQASGNYTISDANSFPYSGAIAEVLIYNRAVTETERQSIENYLAEKWGVWTVVVPVRAGLEMWLTTDGINLSDTSQVVARNNAYYLTKWQGRSLAARSAYQTTASLQPQVVPNAVNGRVTVRFDGVDDYLTTACNIAGDKSVFTVMKRSGTANGLEISSTANWNNPFFGNDAGTSEGKGHFTSSRANKVMDLQVPLVADQWLMKRYVRSGTTEKLQVNDATATATNVPDYNNGFYTLSDQFGQPFKGDIAEVLIYSRAVTDAESTSILNYLQSKWSWTPDSAYAVVPDLKPPVMTVAAPAAGTRVKQTTPAYASSNAYHTLYLPKDWQAGKKYPVIVEYAPNGPYGGAVYSDTTTGKVDDISLGYGITGGTGYILIGMPTIGGSPLSDQLVWWGDINSTKDYCLQTVRYICENYGGDPASVFISGFSRGSLACNYLGLADDTMADVWLGFIPHAHYDGQIQWGYPGDDAASALTRLQRLKGRAQHISHEIWIKGPEDYLPTTGIDMSAIRMRTMPYGNHTDLWALRPIQLRRDTRAWLQQTLIDRPGTHSISGRVTNASGTALANVRIQSGYTHFTFTAADGTYTLGSLIDSARTVSATISGATFSDQSVTLSGSNVPNVNFQAAP